MFIRGEALILSLHYDFMGHAAAPFDAWLSFLRRRYSLSLQVVVNRRRGIAIRHDVADTAYSVQQRVVGFLIAIDEIAIVIVDGNEVS